MRRISVITAAVLGTLSAAPAAWAQATPAPALAAAQSEDARLAAWFETAFDQSLALSPESMTSLGLKTDYDKLDDYTDAGSAEGQALAERQLAEMKARFDYDALSPQSQVSWRLFEHGVVQGRLGERWRDWGYLFAANRNPTTGLPVFLINEHAVDSVEDAQAYVARIREAERVMGEVTTVLKARADKGVISPAFVFAPSIANTRQVIAGAPFDDGEANPVWADLR